MDFSNFKKEQFKTPVTNDKKETKQVTPKSNGNTDIKVNVREKHMIKAKEEPINSNLKLHDKYLNLSDEEIKEYTKEFVASLKYIETELNDIYIERENEIELLLLTLVSATNAFLHGPAGTGKSQLTEDLAKRVVNSSYYRILLGKTTEPSEIFGPVSINAMKEDKYRVNTANKLPTCSIGFTDEIFKANSAILNGLLTIMNEKLFFNDKVEEVPLISLIGASNEYPENDSLIALYDRFLLRWHVKYIQESSSRMKLFNNFLGGRVKKSKLRTKEVAATSTAHTTIDIQGILLLNEVCKEVTVPVKVLKCYNSLLLDIEKLGIIVSDRRKNEALKVLQASALLKGREHVTVEDFETLRFTFWNEQEDVDLILTEIYKYSNPNKTRIDNYKMVIENFKSEMAELDKDKDSKEYVYDKARKIQEIKNKIDYSVTEIDKILLNLDSGTNDYKEFETVKNNMEQYRDSILSMIDLLV